MNAKYWQFAPANSTNSLIDRYRNMLNRTQERKLKCRARCYIKNDTNNNINVFGHFGCVPVYIQAILDTYEIDSFCA